MSPDESQRMQAVIEAVRSAARLCRTVQGELGRGVIQKKDASPVTVADYGSQAIVCRALAEAFGDDPVIAEEDTGYLDDPAHREVMDQVVEQVRAEVAGADAASVRRWIGHGAASGTPARFWTLDPIDGTKGFLRGDQYVVALALIEDGMLKASIMAGPNMKAPDGGTGLLFTACAGSGAYVQPLWRREQPSRLQVSDLRELKSARFVESLEAAHSSHGASQRLAERVGIERPPARMDSQAKYGVVAAGQADLFLRFRANSAYVENIWDHAPGALLVQEAGGRVTDVFGRPLDFTRGRKLDRNQGLVVSNGLLHEAVLAAAREHAGVPGGAG